jgi:acyl-CoA thioester hydrolase
MANTAYLDRAADVRFSYFAANGFPAARFSAEHVGPVISRDDVSYRRELRLLEEFVVDLRMAGLSDDGVRFEIENTFREITGGLVATVRSDGVWYDLRERRPRIPPPDLDSVQRRVPRTDGFHPLAARRT